MSSQSAVTVSNLALLSIGVQAQVSSIQPSDGSAAANACSTLYAFIYEQLSRTARWGCLKKQTNLTLIQAAQGTPENPSGTLLPIPQQPWLYAYLYPPDALFMRAILAPAYTYGNSENQLSISNNVTPLIPGQYQIPYEIGYSQDASGNPLEVVLTNQCQAVANYTVNQPNPNSWDSLFTSAYVASLASYLVPALSLQPNLMQAQIAIAERMIATARAQDGNESPQNQNTIPSWIRARCGATGFSEWRGGYNGYGEMSWPYVP